VGFGALVIEEGRIMEKTTIQPKPRRLWRNIAQMAITIIVVLMVLITEIMRPIFVYRSGLENGIGKYSDVIVGWIPLVLFPFVFLLVFIQLMLLIGTLVFKIILRKKRNVRIGYEPVLLFFISLLTIVAWPFLLRHGHDMRYFTKGFHDRMERELDVPATQQWLQTLERPIASKTYFVQSWLPHDPESYGPDTKFIKSLDSSEWPKRMRLLNPHPKIVSIQPDKNKEATIRLEWSYVFAHWGLVIGPTSMQIPESDMRHGGEYRLALAPGAYVWYRIK
jgi:hypothetical protein